MGFFSSLWGKIIGFSLPSFLPYVVAGWLVTLGGAFFYGHHVGYTSCHASVIQAAETNAQKQANAGAAEAKAHVQVVHDVQVHTATLIKKVPVYVKDNRACDVPVDVSRLLNDANK